MRELALYHLRGRKWTGAAISHLSQLYRNLPAEDMAWFTEAGKGGTRAHAAGHKAFGVSHLVPALPGEIARTNPDAIVASDLD